MLTEKHYRYFQQRLTSNQLFRGFWIFWGNYAFVIFAAVAIWILLSPTDHENWQALLGLSIISLVIARGLIVNLIVKLYKRICPYQLYHYEPSETRFFSLRDDNHDSFPSGHTAGYFSVAVVVYLFFPILGVILITTSLMAGIGRVVMGWHWPSDILGGLIVGSAVACVVVRFGFQYFFTLT